MSSPKVAVFGASGFVGSTVIERLFFSEAIDFTAYVGSFGRTGRIARLPIPVKAVDVTDAAAVDEAVADCDVIVNCARGNSAAMMRGIQKQSSSMKPIALSMSF